MLELALNLDVASEGERLLEAQDSVRSYCGWHIAPLRTEVLRGTCADGRTIILPTLRIESVTSVSIDGTALAASDYTFDARSATVILDFGLTGSGPIQVTLIHGYEEPPHDVSGVVKAIAGRAVGSSSGYALTGRTTGPFSEQYASAGDLFLSSEKWVLDRYRLPSRP